MTHCCNAIWVLQPVVHDECVRAYTLDDTLLQFLQTGFLHVCSLSALQSASFLQRLSSKSSSFSIVHILCNIQDGHFTKNGITDACSTADEEATDEEATDEEATDEEATDEDVDVDVVGGRHERWTDMNR